MSRTRQYHKRQAKAIQRQRRPAAERLQRDHVQAQRAIKALEQALHEVGLPDNLVKEIGGSSIVFRTLKHLVGGGRLRGYTFPSTLSSNAGMLSL